MRRHALTATVMAALTVTALLGCESNPGGPSAPTVPAGEQGKGGGTTAPSRPPQSKADGRASAAPKASGIAD